MASGATLCEGGKAHGVVPRGAHGSAPSVNLGEASVASGVTLCEGGKAHGVVVPRGAHGSAPSVHLGEASVASGATLCESETVCDLGFLSILKLCTALEVTAGGSGSRCPTRSEAPVAPAG